MKQDKKTGRFIPLTKEEKEKSREKRLLYLREWHRKYRENNRDKIRLDGRERWKKNRQDPEWVKNYRKFQREWIKNKRKENPDLRERERKQYAVWYDNNRDKKINYNKEWREKNKDYRRQWQKEYLRKKSMTDDMFLLRRRLRGRMNTALYERGLWKHGKTVELLGMTFAEFRPYIESLFKDGMSWDNHGEWHLDHIKPCSSFDLTKEDEQKKCFHYTNLQPLWAKDNLKKGKKII